MSINLLSIKKVNLFFMRPSRYMYLLNLNEILFLA